MQKVQGYLIGRFSPLHSGHMHLIRESRRRCDHLTIFIGSANSARTIKNPWTFHERAEKIQTFLNHQGITNVTLVPQNDYKYNDTQWLGDISSYIEHKRGDAYVIMFGHNKSGNDYLSWFPQYRCIDIPSITNIAATDIRNQWFETSPHMFEPSVMDDFRYFAKEKEQFSGYPYLDTLQFNCGDALVECAGHVLLIKRKRAPGAGTWALPGGYKNGNETFKECIFRELTEETNLRVPEKVLLGSIVSTRMFDSPTRGMGITRNTMACHIKIELNSNGRLPEFRPADDAIDGEWVLISDALNDPKYAMFDDHKDIIMEMLKVLPLPAYKNSHFTL